MSNLSRIKKQLSMSTTLPAGNDGETPQWMMGSAHSHSHDHSSCCGHDHHHDEDEDTTNPTGGCC